MRGVKDLQYRFLNATNWKCKTAPPGDGLTPAEFREQDFLRKLSKGRMDPLDSMLGLVRLTDVQPNAFSDLAVTRHQAQRMLDNLDAHGEIFVMLREGSENGGPHQKFFQDLKQNYHSLVTELMKCAGSRDEEHQPVPVAGDSRLDTVKILAGFRAAVGDTRRPAIILEEQLVLAKDLRREFDGTREQKEFAAQLGSVKMFFTQYNEISTDELTKMLASALRKVGAHDPTGIAQTRVEQLTLETPRHLQAKLLPPLLEAMSDVIDGVGSARNDLKRSLNAIGKAAKETRDHVGNLNSWAGLIRNRYPHVGEVGFVAKMRDDLRSLSMKERAVFLSKANIPTRTWDATAIQNEIRSLANVTALDLINEQFEDLDNGEALTVVQKNIWKINDDMFAVVAAFFARYPWIPSYFEKLGETPLAAVIKEFKDRSHAGFDFVAPEFLSDAQEIDLGRFQDSRTANPWHDLYRFFGIPDEPAKRGEE
jgi:hypothetical protein